MADQPVDSHVERPGPAEFRDPYARRELRRASIWLGGGLAIFLLVILAQPLLLIIGGMIFAVLVDGGARLLGRALPIARSVRLAIVILGAIAFLVWTFWYAGTTIALQAEALRDVVSAQLQRLEAFATEIGLMPEDASGIAAELLGTLGTLTTAVTTVIGVAASIILMLVIGVFIAIEPRLYDRGIAWMLPIRHRQRFYEVSDRVAWTLRRLLAGRLAGMAFEGVFTYVMLAYAGQLFGIPPVPLAGLLALITALLAFIPNIGAVISGVLMVLVGFAAGTEQGLWTIFVYLFVQQIDGYLVVPLIARMTVDLAPALVLAVQLLMGVLFGILGLLLADLILAAVKAALIELSSDKPAEQVAEAEAVEPA